MEKHPAEYLIADMDAQQAHIYAAVDEVCSRFLARYDPFDVSYVGNSALCSFITQYQVIAPHVVRHLDGPVRRALDRQAPIDPHRVGKAVLAVMAGDVFHSYNVTGALFAQDLMDVVCETGPAHLYRGDEPSQLQQLLSTAAQGAFAPGETLPEVMSVTAKYHETDPPTVAVDPTVLAALRHVTAEHLVHDHNEFVRGKDIDLDAWLASVPDLDTRVFEMPAGASYESVYEAVCAIADTLLPGAVLDIPTSPPAGFSCWYVGMDMYVPDVLADPGATYYLIARLQDELEIAGF